MHQTGATRLGDRVDLLEDTGHPLGLSGEITIMRSFFGAALKQWRAIPGVRADGTDDCLSLPDHVGKLFRIVAVGDEHWEFGQAQLESKRFQFLLIAACDSPAHIGMFGAEVFGNSLSRKAGGAVENDLVLSVAHDLSRHLVSILPRVASLFRQHVFTCWYLFADL